jgi:phytol kinase
VLEEANPWVLSGVYLTLVLATGELLRRRLALAPDVTRKAVLGLLSCWCLPAAYLFRDSRAAAIPILFLLLAAALYLSFRFELLRAVEDEGASPGSFLAPLSAALLFRLLGDGRAHVAVSGILAMALGDGAAALVGRRLGTRRFRMLGQARTMEGTLALFLGASGAGAPVLALMGGVDWHQAVAFSLIAGTVAASVEAISPYGSDNVTVPLAVAGTLVLLLSASG